MKNTIQTDIIRYYHQILWHQKSATRNINMNINNGVKSNNKEKKFDNKVIQAEGEIYWETKSKL